MTDKKLTDAVKATARHLGAELVGIAPVERFEHAPLMLSPRGLLPMSRSVVVIATCYLDASLELMEKEYQLHNFDLYGQNQSGTGMNGRLNSIAFHVARFLEKHRHRSLPLPASNIWRFRPYKDVPHPFAPDLVHRYAAVAAGLGEIGWNGLFTSPEYGPRTRVNSIITEAPLVPTPMYDGPALCDKCMACVKYCPTKALSEEIEGMNKLEIGERVFEFPNINKWRCIWASFNMLVPPLPKTANEEVFFKLLETCGNRGPDTGNCIYVCLPPHLRRKDARYSRHWRRKRRISKVSGAEITRKAKQIALRGGADWLAAAPVKDFAAKGIDLAKFLPDVCSAVVVGIHFSSEVTRDIISSRLTSLVFDLAHLFQNLGYSSLAKAILPEKLAAAALELGVFDERNELITADGTQVQFRYVLTAAPLRRIRVRPKARKTVPRKGKEALTDAARAFALERGADLFGVSSVERIEEILPQLRRAYGRQKLIGVANQDEGLHRRGYGATIPLPVKTRREIRAPTDYLPRARSVIVLGLHYPDACMERAGQPPAESIGPYAAHAQYIVIEELSSIAFDVARFLKSMGYRARITLDLTDIASEVHHPWGRVPTEGQPKRIPDATANRFAAVCAGLGEIGWSGVVLTPQYGLRQRFISVVTDALLKPGPIYKGPRLCRKCFRCAEACPVNALSKTKKVCVETEVTKFEFGRLDEHRCDWAKKYALVGDEGPKYMGSRINILPPKKITQEALCKALRQMDPVQKRLLCTLERCLVVCPAGGQSGS